jgi:hypothetical protein
MGDLSDHFSRVEFSCRCGCGFDTVDPRLIALLERARAIFGRRMVVLSGCRCKQHNKDEGGAHLSQHMGLENGVPTACRAADILVNSTIERHALVRAFLDSGATGVGVAKSFVHGDCGLADPGLGIVRPALWTY